MTILAVLIFVDQRHRDPTTTAGSSAASGRAKR
jgi:hypothetical protein